MSEKPKQHFIKQEDAALLRECLSWCWKKAPPQVKFKVHDTLKRYAEKVGKYCECPARVFVGTENKFACLDCGKRHIDSKLKLLES